MAITLRTTDTAYLPHHSSLAQRILVYIHMCKLLDFRILKTKMETSHLVQAIAKH